jgi:uncharacterized protein (TIGR02099 family)
MPEAGNRTPIGPGTVAEIEQAIDKAEDLVERAVDNAERSLARRLGLRGLRIVVLGVRAAWVALIVAYFAFLLTVLGLRYYALPHIDEWRTQIGAIASKALRVPVTIGSIESDWDGLHPRLLLRDVQLQDASGRTALALQEVDAVLSWTSVLAWQARMHSLTVVAPQVEVRRLRDHRFEVAGFIVDPQAPQTDSAMLEWLLGQQRIRIRGAQVHLIDETAVPAQDAAQGAAAAEYDFQNVEFLLVRELTGHRFALRMQPPPEFSAPLDLRGRFSRAWGQPVSRMASWSGQIYAQIDDADLARLDGLIHVVPAPARLDRARGALRAWLDFSALRVTRLRADVALTGVQAQWRPDLDLMQLDSVRGRITQSLSTSGSLETEELSLTGLSMDGPNELHLPPTDMLLRFTHPLAGAAGEGGKPANESEQNLFEANRLALADWTRLARQFPLPQEWLSLIERTAARGTLEDLHAAWNGAQAPPREYALRTRFSGLGFALERKEAGGLPNSFESLAGSIDLTQDGGTLRLDDAAAQLRLPEVFGDHALAFDSLSAQVRWSRDARSRWTVELDSLSAANADLDVRASGGFLSAGANAETEPARLELSGRVARAKVSATATYLPISLPPATRGWLKDALLDGTVSEGSFLVRGDPARFPFADPHSGEFHAGLQVRDGRLDFAPPPPNANTPGGPAWQRWPELSAIEASVSFDRDRMQINGRHARAYGYDLTNVTAQIPHMATPNQHLSVEGQGSGPLSELLRYAAASPVNAWAGNWLGDSRAAGQSRLGLKLDIPLAHASDAAVNGSVTFLGDNLVLRPDVAPFSAVNGELDFSERGLRIPAIEAGFLGGQVHLTGDTRADGVLLIQGSGTATPFGARPMLQAPPLQRMLDFTRGQVHYTAQVALRPDSVGVRVDSDLVGLAANLPPPFRKAEAEAKALHVQIEPEAGSNPARDTLRASLAGAMDAELHRVTTADGKVQIERGYIGVGAHPNAPDRGLLLFVEEPGFDADRWKALLGAPAGAPSSTGAGEEIAFDHVVLHTQALTVAEKTISNVSLSAARDGATWSIDIDSDEASGSVQWSDPGPAGHARLIARLVKLRVPERDQKQVNELLSKPPTDFPELDVVADQFELGRHSLGRLELVAQNSGEGPDRVWNLANLAISNPDGKVTGTGAWQREAGATARRMYLKLAIRCTNVGGMLDRFGLAGHVKNGSGKLEGELSWLGSPFSIDFPTLSGQLRLSAEKGQVLQLDAGAGRLLAVFSFESFLHLVTGDLREFSAGVAFDSVSASATISKGVLSTDDFLMKGASGAGRVKGSLDLLAETQNLQVVVVPEISASVPTLAYAAFVNPAIGLSTFVGTFLLNKPLSAVFTRIYSVTGAWSNPQIKSLRSESEGPLAGAGGAAAPSPAPPKP